jgi:hypothetical protein
MERISFSRKILKASFHTVCLISHGLLDLWISSNRHILFHRFVQIAQKLAYPAVQLLQDLARLQ